MGKMAPSVFSPFNLPYYLFALSSTSRLCALTMVSVALKFYFAFIFLYLFARLVDIGWFGAIFGALSFISSYHFYFWIIYGIEVSALCVPLLFLLSELYFHKRRRLSLILLPWASAFSFFGGHFETAFLAHLTVGIYFMARLWADAALPSQDKLRHLSAFVGALLGGACISGFYMLAGQDYLHNSYTLVWRSLPSYGWSYNSIAKHLTGDDFPVAFLGLAGVGLSIWLFQRLPKAWREGSTSERLISVGLTAAVLGIALAFLANLGLDLSFARLTTHIENGSLIVWSADLLMLFLAFWAWGASESIPLRILGWIMLVILLIYLKLPPLTNGMAHLPLIGEFRNSDYHYAFYMAAGLFCGAAFDRLSILYGQESGVRRRTASLAFVFLGICLAAAAAAGPLEGLVARNFPTGLIPAQGAGQRSGGIMGPERLTTASHSRLVTGWVPGYPPASSIQVGLLENGQLTHNVQAHQEFPCSSGRCYFNAVIALPDRPGEKSIVAVVNYAPGQQQVLYGPIVTIARRGQGFWCQAALAAAAILFILSFWFSPGILRLLYLGLIVVWCWPISERAAPTDEASYSFPGVKKIQEDSDLFRVTGFNNDFLRADFLNLYKLSDLRTGADGLDVFGMIEFSRLCYNFLARRDDPAAMDLGLRLLGLANVRYLLSASQDTVKHPDLQPVYQGQDMLVYRNSRAMPRAVFFDQQVYAPLDIKDLWDRSAESRILGQLVAALLQGKLDPAHILLLHDQPILKGGSPRSTRKPPAVVRIREYESNHVIVDVEAPNPGFVFLSDNYFPGWRATVNGQPAAILRSWITFRAVEVPGGKSTIEFLYKPAFTGLPLLVSVFSCIAWFLLFLRFKNEPEEPAEAAPPVKNNKAAKMASAATQKLFRASEVQACAQATQYLCLGLIGSALLYWLIWAGFLYQGISVNWIARFLLVAGIALLGFSARRRD